MLATRLFAAALAGIAASTGAVAAQVMGSGKAPRQPKTVAASRTVGSSRNGGHLGGNRATQRAAQKVINVRRHRAACRG